MILRRICFGEPKAGMAPFAALLKGLDEQASYCNRIGVLAHDRVTDLPFSIPALGLPWTHPTELKFVSAAPTAGDDWGIFAYHHVALYLAGATAAALDPVHLEAARLCDAIYARPGTPPEPWDLAGSKNGVFAAVRREGSRAYVVFRGSDTPLDWLRDITPIDTNDLWPHDGFGPVWAGFMIGMDAAWQAVRDAVANADEVVFTGHSLGAARAGIAAGLALLEKRDGGLK